MRHTVIKECVRRVGGRELNAVQGFVFVGAFLLLALGGLLVHV